VFEVEGSTKLTDFNTITNFGLTDKRMTTISGVLLRHLDRLPAVGDEVVVEGVRLQVLAIEGHRISRLRAMSVTDKAHQVAADAGSLPPGETRTPGGREHNQPGQEDQK
jgi:CBS domain containing-hemolysin-like protein